MLDDTRPDPDLLLAAIQKEDAEKQRGILKIFLGMAAGAGKTYSMLKAAQLQRVARRTVIIGYVESHGRKETDALAEGLEVVPRKPIVHRGVTVTEMDLDAVLARKPQLAIVDELAHTNAPGCRHTKRYQDVIELLDAGIDVYTTLNVQHIESRSGTVREITGATIHETVPDSLIDNAEIELVDLSPDVLLKRLDEGKVYIPERAKTAARNFFQKGNLTALREIALRVAAERVGQDVRDYMQAQHIDGPWKTGHRLLVAVSPSPFSEQMVRWTRWLADSLECSWIAVHVETSRSLTEVEQTRLTRNLTLAKELGAETRTTMDEDIVGGLLRIARAQNVTQIVVGKPDHYPWHRFLRGRSLLSRLVRESGNIDVHIVRVDSADARSKRAPLLRMPAKAEWKQYAAVFGVVGVMTLINLLLSPIIGVRSMALIFLLLVVVLALRVGRGPVYLAAALSALSWDFVFLPPRYTFHIKSFEDAIMFAMYFVVAVAMGQLISRIRAKERIDTRREERASAIYLLTLELGDAASGQEIERVIVDNIARVFNAEATLLLSDAGGRLLGDLPEKELGAAQWAFDHGKLAGRFTDTLPMAEAMYLPLRTTGDVLGILRLHWRQTANPTREQCDLLDGFQRHIALVLDRQRLRDVEEQTRILTESERLSKVLLNSISHELRTPITAIQGAVSAMLAVEEPAVQRVLSSEIQQAAERLNSLVGNILDMTRIESGHVKPHMDWCDVTDLFHVSLKRTEHALAGHSVDTDVPPTLPLVRMDFVLMVEALANLLFNAAAHTPLGTHVQLSAAVEDKELIMTVADRGPGLPPTALEHVFEKFYRAPGAAAGGTGLGLSIVQGFVEAQGGHIEAQNRPVGGAAFSIRVPLSEVPTI